jgi:hypothetical protein
MPTYPQDWAGTLLIALIIWGTVLGVVFIHG